MTERLSQLLHDEATGLVPPPPDAASVIGAGRRIRQRRRITGAVVATVAAVVVTTVGVGVLASADPEARGADPTSTGRAAPSPVVWAVGSDVHVGDAVAQVPDTVHSLHYTSVGVLVRSNPNGGASDGSGPESLTLVRWDGSTEDLGTIPEGWGPATDADRDVYVLAEARDGGFVAVVRDATTGETVQTVTLPDLPPSYWDVPPLALEGDSLFVGYRKSMAAVDLSTGESTEVEGSDGGAPSTSGGRMVVADQDSIDVVDALSAEVLLSVPVDRDTLPYGTLSPDGDYLRVVLQDESTDRLAVHDVATGEVVEVPGLYGWGWTADSRLTKVEGDTVTTCDPATGQCQETTISPAVPRDAEVRIGGLVYES